MMALTKIFSDDGKNVDNAEVMKKALAKLDGILTDSKMAELNHKVENDKEEPAKVAHDYLVEKGILKK